MVCVTVGNSCIGCVLRNPLSNRGGAVLLEGDARKTVLVAYQERKQENLTHPLLSESVPFGLLPHLQARLLARTLRGDMAEYLPYLVR